MKYPIDLDQFILGAEVFNGEPPDDDVCFIYRAVVETSNEAYEGGRNDPKSRAEDFTNEMLDARKKLFNDEDRDSRAYKFITAWIDLVRQAWVQGRLDAKREASAKGVTPRPPINAPHANPSAPVPCYALTGSINTLEGWNVSARE